MKPKLIPWPGWITTLIILLTIAQMAWLSDHGRPLRTDISANGIADLELAKGEKLCKILEVWNTKTTDELQPFIKSLLFKEDPVNQKVTLAKTARTDIYWDFPFIFFYSLVVFMIFYKALNFWVLDHLKTLLKIIYTSEYRSLSFLSGKKIWIAIICSALIGILDVIENIFMLLRLADWQNDTILPAFWFAAPKFIMLVIVSIFSLLTFLYFFILLLFTAPGMIIRKLRNVAVKIDSPY